MNKTTIKECTQCGMMLPSTSFLPTKNLFYPDGYIPICNSCLEKMLKVKGDWNYINKICQFLDIPFVPARWVDLYEKDEEHAIVTYAKLFQSEEYKGIDWLQYEKDYEELQKQGDLELMVPGMEEKRLQELRMKWGPNYDAEELAYLERLYDGILNSQNVNGALQTDQAIKLCKISLTIDSRIREGTDIDKLLGSYEKLVKVADFTPKNVKNVSEFDSVGEIFSYLEKTGFVNKFYDGVTRDIVDGTMANIQKFCQRLYTNESGIGEEITKRIEALQIAHKLEQTGEWDMDDDYTEKKVDFFDDFEEEEFDPEV